MMRTIQIKRVLVGLIVALILAAPAGAQQAREGPSPWPVKVPAQGLKEERAPSLIDVEMLKRAEDRGDVLRAQLLDLEMKEIDIQARIDDLDYRLRPECIQLALSLVGSSRPMDELRDDLRGRLEGEKGRANQQLELLAASQARLETAIRDADAECALLRERLRLPRASDACGENN